jgi:nitrite reductase/ring-hydroxylating ferredoxin subunit
MGGEIEGTTITCECHGSEFDMSNGAVLEGPATEPVASYEVREENGELQVGV